MHGAVLKGGAYTLVGSFRVRLHASTPLFHSFTLPNSLTLSLSHTLTTSLSYTHVNARVFSLSLYLEFSLLRPSYPTLPTLSTAAVPPHVHECFSSFA